MNKGKIRVLYLVPYCGSGGVIQVVRSIMQYCSRESFELFLMTMEPERSDHSFLPLFPKDVRHIFVPTSKTDVLIGRTRRIRREIEKISPDVIHTSGMIPDLLVSRLYPEKQITILHSDYVTDYTHRYGILPGTALAVLQLRAVRRADTVVSCSETLSKQVLEKYRLDVPWIRNGVIAEETPAYSRESLRRKLGLPLNRRIFVYAADFTELKNQEFLIREFEKIPANDSLLLLLGDGPRYSELSRKYGTYKHTLLKGSVLNVRDYLLAADYYVSSSLLEGLPMAVLEAMAAGLPLLLSEIGPHSEIMTLSEGSGELFRPDDGDSFAAAFKRLVTGEIRHMSLCSRDSVYRHFNAEDMSRQYQQLYREIVKRNRMSGGQRC